MRHKIDDQKDNAPLISRDSTKSIKTSDNNLLENEIEKKNPIINNIKILNNNSTNNSPNSLTIDKNIPLNQNDFLLENRIEQTTHIINLNKPYSISISTINETKLNISKSNNSQITSLINSIVPKNSQYKFNFESTINFEFWNNSDIIVKLNNIPLDKFLSKNNLSIRGSYEADKSQLYIGFYNKLTQ